jgi:ammonia channel protein AmtB
MQAKRAAIAETPKVVRIALWVNLVLLLAAFVLPRTLPGGGFDAAAGAVLLFAGSMVVILIVGIAAATRAYLLARRQDQRVKWTAFVPLLLFFVGIFVTLALVYFESSSPGSVN